MTAFVAPNATVIGEVHISAQASIWFGCVLRAEVAPVFVGARTNIQDLTVLHSGVGRPCIIGEIVTVGHRAVVHAATLEDGALIGIGAIVLSGAPIGSGTVVGAGALVPEDASIPTRHLVLGVPARVIRELSASEVARHQAIADQYVEHARAFLPAHRPVMLGRPASGLDM